MVLKWRAAGQPCVPKEHSSCCVERSLEGRRVEREVVRPLGNRATDSVRDGEGVN